MGGNRMSDARFEEIKRNPTMMAMIDVGLNKPKDPLDALAQRLIRDGKIDGSKYDHDFAKLNGELRREQAYSEDNIADASGDDFDKNKLLDLLVERVRQRREGK